MIGKSFLYELDLPVVSVPYFPLAAHTFIMLPSLALLPSPLPQWLHAFHGTIFQLFIMSLISLFPTPSIFSFHPSLPPLWLLSLYLSLSTIIHPQNPVSPLSIPCPHSSLLSFLPSFIHPSPFFPSLTLCLFLSPFSLSFYPFSPLSIFLSLPLSFSLSLSFPEFNKVISQIWMGVFSKFRFNDKISFAHPSLKFIYCFF